MRSRITRSIVGVTALVVVVLGIPLAVAVQRLYTSRATVDLQRRAATAVAELTLPLDADSVAEAAAEPDAPGDFSVYDLDGGRIFGAGPARADEPTQRALAGEAAEADGADLIVALPITDRTDETVVGAVRVGESADGPAGEARRAWALMGLAGIAGVGIAYLVGRREAERLAAPINALAVRAEALSADLRARPAVPSGIAEIDTVAAALDASTAALADRMAREREFSANASHQLRTPLAALRLDVDRLRTAHPGEADLDGAAAELSRLEATVEHLLAVARGTSSTAEPVHLEGVVQAAGERWTRRFGEAGRSLTVVTSEEMPLVRASATAVATSLDALLENALTHGDGAVELLARRAPGGVVIAVTDQGSGIEVPAELFGRGSGIGLALARDLVEAEGGRLLLASTDPTSFHLAFVAPGEDLLPFD